MLGGITLDAIVKGTIEFVVGFAQMLWVALIRPYWWVWLIIVAVLVVTRLRPSRRR